jgi:hypothetical protein
MRPSEDLSEDLSEDRERRASPVAAPSGALTPPPDDIPITDALVAWADLAGTPKPTAEHVRACLADAKSKGQSFADWTERFKGWLIREKNFASGRRTRDDTRKARYEPAPAPYHRPAADNPLASPRRPPSQALAKTSQGVG